MSFFYLTIILLFQVFNVFASYYVSYVDSLGGWYDTAILQSWGVPGYSSHQYNVIILAFWLTSGPTDALDPWANPTGYFSASTMQTISGKSNPSDADFRTGLRNLYHGANIKIMMSCFGATEFPTASYDPVTLGNEIASFVKNYQLDGVDIDWEDSAAFNSNGLGENWLTNLTTTLRDNLPSSQNYIITHAPQAPYFFGTGWYPHGAYLTITQKVGNLINWYNLQFYNQGADLPYNTFDTLFVSADNSSVFEMINGKNADNVKIPSYMIVVGKPVTTGDVSNTGWVSASNLQSYFEQAISNSGGNYPSWNAGFMTWQFSSDRNENFDFSNTVIKAF